MKTRKQNNTLRCLLLIILTALCALSFPGQAEAAELSFTVEYDPIVCGEPTTFTLIPSTDNGSNRYYLNYIDVIRSNNQWEDIIDPSRMSFVSQNTFTFTFYASGKYALRFGVMDLTTYSSVYKTIYITVDDPTHPDVDTIADNVAAECLKTCSTDFDKAVWLHDWLRKNMKYDYSFLYCGAEGALARGTGTCQSYHTAYTMLLKRVGVECGESLSSQDNHIWTAVKMDGEWYQVDVTWDDVEYIAQTFEYYLYFGLTDELMQLVHSDHTPQNGQESTHLENNYLIRSGLIKKWSDPLAAQIQTKLDMGVTEFTIASTGDPNPSSQYNIYYRIAIWELMQREWTAKGSDYELKIEYLGGEYGSTVPKQMSVKATKLDDIRWTDGTWSVNASVVGESAALLIACYSGSGQMLSLHRVEIDPHDPTSLSGSYAMSENCCYRIMLLNSGGIPLCEAWENR